MRDDWPEQLLASIAKQAVRDYRAGYHKPGIMDAATWLRLAGLLTDEGLMYERGSNEDDERRSAISGVYPLPVHGSG